MTVYIVATMPCDPADVALLARLAVRKGSQARVGALDLPGWMSLRPCVAVQVERSLVRPRPKKRIPARKAGAS